ncbi:hypothetical protein ACFWOT_06290 [Streptomyces sp. NPDC058440]|uniref:hypothetical protein n=1 Tax=Streptomyces sp. NPDC058440 TaxID=3346501 RepID=UPI00365515EC
MALEFHRTLPKGYTLPKLPDGTTAPGTSLLCRRMFIGGVRIDHQGGPWADCQPVTGTDDPQPAGGMGLWGFHDKGLSGTRLMVSNPEADVAYGVVSLSDGTQVKATTATVPGTTYRAWAEPIPNGQTITTVNQYDTHHHRLSHDTNWRDHRRARGGLPLKPSDSGMHHPFTSKMRAASRWRPAPRPTRVKTAKATVAAAPVASASAT